MVRKKGFSARHVKDPTEPGWYQLHSLFTFRNPKTKTLRKAEGWSFFYHVGKRFYHKGWKKYARFYTYKDAKTREIKRTTSWKKLKKIMRGQSRISALDEIKKYNWETAHARYHYVRWVKRRKKKSRSSLGSKRSNR